MDVDVLLHDSGSSRGSSGHEGRSLVEDGAGVWSRQELRGINGLDSSSAIQELTTSVKVLSNESIVATIEVTSGESGVVEVSSDDTMSLLLLVVLVLLLLEAIAVEGRGTSVEVSSSYLDGLANQNRASIDHAGLLLVVSSCNRAEAVSGSKTISETSASSQVQS